MLLNFDFSIAMIFELFYLFVTYSSYSKHYQYLSNLQEEVYLRTTKPLVDSVLQVTINVEIFYLIKHFIILQPFYSNFDNCWVFLGL